MVVSPRTPYVDTEHQVPPIQFAPARGVRLAYQVFGSGRETVVAVPPTAQNIEVAWECPPIRRMLLHLGSFCTYLHFDKRGTGCSDRRSRVADVDERVDDLRAVMDHAGIERAHLFGSSEGGPMTLLFAATYPDRVDSVVLFGSGASLFPAGMSEAEVADRRALHHAYASRWGTAASRVAEGFAPSLVASDPSFVDWHRRYERLSASSDSLRDLLELGLHMDVRELLPTLDVPTLVIHRSGDRVVPVERSREVAAAMPNARLHEEPGEDHFAYAGETEGWLAEFERFVTGRVRSRPTPSVARPRVRIRTLGRFDVEVDGEEVPRAAWGSRLARQLCKRLVSARGWPVTRDELFDLLWPDETDRQRLGPRLSVQLSTVRRVLGGGVIADRESVRLDLGEVDTDLEALHRAEGDEAVVTAYRGPFLPDDVYEDWARGTRDEARARFVLAAHRLAETALASGTCDRAVELARRLLEADRHDEAAHRLLVAALLQAGVPREAERAHAAWTAAMQELGLPDPPYDPGLKVV